jgi:transposase-like protein
MKENGLVVLEVGRVFAAEETCRAYLEAIRWPFELRCVKCAGCEVSRFTTHQTARNRTHRGGVAALVPVPARVLYQCKRSDCRHQFSVTSGTRLDRTRLPLRTWFLGAALFVSSEGRLPASQLARDLGISYRSAWFLLQRIREAVPG